MPNIPSLLTSSHSSPCSIGAQLPIYSTITPLYSTTQNQSIAVCWQLDCLWKISHTLSQSIDFWTWYLLKYFLPTVETHLETPTNPMLGLRRGLFQPGGSINTIYAPQALHPSSAASRLSPRLLPTKSYFVTRRYALPRKPAFLPPPQRPLPVPSKKEGIYPEVQDALRSADVSTQLRVIMRHMVHPGKTFHFPVFHHNSHHITH